MKHDFFERMQERDQAAIPLNTELKAKIARTLGLEQRPSWTARLRSVVVSLVRQPVGGFALACALVLVVSLGLQQRGALPSIGVFGPAVDDWSYSGVSDEREQKAMQATGLVGAGRSTGLSVGNSPFQRAAAPTALAPMMASESAADTMLGFSVGGAKDINTFRDNIANGFLPQEQDLTTEGLFYDYAFDTGEQMPCAELFCPSYTRARVQHPVTGKEELYLSVGLNSNLSAADFVRPKTDFVVVLDISGSMGSLFDQYYMDRAGTQREIPTREAKKTKMQLATEALVSLVDQLHPDDRLGIVVFSDTATVAKPLRLLRETDRASLKRHILELQPTNGTNMSAGLEAGRALFGCPDTIGPDVATMCVDNGYAKRLIFITDAMPNQGEFGADGLQGETEALARQKIYTSFIGVGVDFQTELIQALTKVRGANYLAIHSGEDFKQRLGEELDFLVTPLVYDLRVRLQGSGFEIEKIYGSPDADRSTGELLFVRTLFPSKTEHGETKGGLILLKLRKTGDSPTVQLKAEYEDGQGKRSSVEKTVSFDQMSVGSFDTNGVRKGVLLAQYAELLTDWIRAERGPSDVFFSAGRTAWDRSSRLLHVSEADKAKFARFHEYFREEMAKIGDTSLGKEQEVLEAILQHATSSNPPRSLPRPVDEWRY